MALNVGQVIAGKYRIEKLLGEGGMGAVYVATNNVLQRQVALKVMTEQFSAVPAAVQRFHREAIAASRVSHPSIVQVFDAGEHEGKPWIAMELLDGESLGDRLERGPLSVHETLKVANGALSALAEVHGEGIVHRDLKPDNIFLAKVRGGADFVPKVLDFGIAKDTSEQKLNKLTATGAVVGTAYYLSPEQAKGLPDIDARTDVYAMGVVLFESLSGRMPYEADTITQLIAKMFTEAPPPLASVAPHVPKPIADVVDTCLEPDRDKRFQSARDLLGAIEAAAAASGMGGVAGGIASSAAMAVTGYADPGLYKPPIGGDHPRLPTANTAMAGGVSQPGFGAPSQPGMGQPGTSQPGTSQPGMIPGTAMGQAHYPSHVGSQPGYPQGSQPGSQPGFPPGSQPGVASIPGTPMPHTAMMHGSMPHGSMPGTYPTPAPQTQGGGSKVGLIVVALLLFLLGAGGVGAAFVFLGDEDGGDDLAQADGAPTAPVAPGDPSPVAGIGDVPTTPAEGPAAGPSADGSGDDTSPGEGEPEATEDDGGDDGEAASAGSSGRRGRRRGRRDDGPEEPAAENPDAPVASPSPAPSPAPAAAPAPSPAPAPAPARPARGLTPQQISQTINSRLEFLNQRCYQRRIRRVQNLAGVVTISFTVAPNGRVSAADVVHNGTGDEWLGNCTRNVVRDTRFPAASNGQPTPARFPFQFR